MAKTIKVTPEVIEKVREEFNTYLERAKASNGKISFSKDLGTVTRPATVYFTEIAWIKMQSLVQQCETEIGWHGIAKRGDDPTKDEYFISDIVVYPQKVTGSTVNPDQEAYEGWLNEFDDETFMNIRMQGHSHVNFSTTPSGTDENFYRSILNQLDDSMFYIFLIYNKKGECTYKIYDMAKNVLFETADVTVKISEDGLGIARFLQDANSKVVRETYTNKSVYGYSGSKYGTDPNYSKSGYSDYGYSGLPNYKNYGADQNKAGKQYKFKSTLSEYLEDDYYDL